jgi:hypothetical protein
MAINIVLRKTWVRIFKIYRTLNSLELIFMMSTTKHPRSLNLVRFHLFYPVGHGINSPSRSIEYFARVSIKLHCSTCRNKSSLNMTTTQIFFEHSGKLTKMRIFSNKLMSWMWSTAVLSHQEHEIGARIIRVAIYRNCCYKEASDDVF